jgi:hypothetical protein
MTDVLVFEGPASLPRVAVALLPLITPGVRRPLGGVRPGWCLGDPPRPMASPIRAPPAALYQPLRPRRQVGSSGCRVGAKGSAGSIARSYPAAASPVKGDDTWAPRL